MPEKAQETGNLEKVLNVKVGARVMLTNNVSVSDGLTNGAYGTISHIITKANSLEVEVILVVFDEDSVGSEAKQKSIYKDIDPQAVPIKPVQVSFFVKQHKSFQAARRQFPLFLAWAVTIHKVQEMTVNEIVVDMSPQKGHYNNGHAHVAFSCVTT